MAFEQIEATTQQSLTEGLKDYGFGSLNLKDIRLNTEANATSKYSLPEVKIENTDGKKEGGGKETESPKAKGKQQAGKTWVNCPGGGWAWSSIKNCETA